MKRSQKQKHANAGFTLVETLMAVLILTIVVAGVFSQINKAQTHYRVEGQKLDLTQQQRQFLDQFTRDLHQAGYPAPASFGLPSPVSLGLVQLSAGITAISVNSVTMEGDLDGTGNVQVVTYTYDAACNCVERSAGAKGAAGTLYPGVQNVVAPGAQGIFEAYDATGNTVILPLTLNAGATTNDASYASLRKIKAVRVTFTLQALSREANGVTPAQVNMTAMARIPND